MTYKSASYYNRVLTKPLVRPLVKFYTQIGQFERAQHARKSHVSAAVGLFEAVRHTFALCSRSPSGVGRTAARQYRRASSAAIPHKAYDSAYVCLFRLHPVRSPPDAP